MLTAFGKLPLLLVIIIPFSEDPVNQKFQRRRFRRRFSLPFCSDPKRAGGDSLSISFPGSFTVAAALPAEKLHYRESRPRLSVFLQAIFGSPPGLPRFNPGLLALPAALAPVIRRSRVFLL